MGNVVRSNFQVPRGQCLAIPMSTHSIRHTLTTRSGDTPQAASTAARDPPDAPVMCTLDRS